jgi:hypothetical protein
MVFKRVGAWGNFRRLYRERLPVTECVASTSDTCRLSQTPTDWCSNERIAKWEGIQIPWRTASWLMKTCKPLLNTYAVCLVTYAVQSLEEYKGTTTTDKASSLARTLASVCPRLEHLGFFSWEPDQPR